MSNKNTGNSKSGQANSYQTLKRWETNRLKKLSRHIKKFPADLVAAAALNNIVYRRHTPKNSEWSHTQINIARLFKMFKGRVDRDIFSANEKVSAPALLVPGPYTSSKQKSFNQNAMFQLGVRARFV